MSLEHAARLRSQAVRLWRAGVEAVLPETLLRNCVSCDGEQLSVAGEMFALDSTPRLVVVGGGKAGGRMVRGLEMILAGTAWSERLCGWVNIPEEAVDSSRPTGRIHLHPARPAGRNEPTLAGVTGTQEILQLVSTLAPEDLCLVLLSGGGSALLPAPAAGITLADKQWVTRELMQSGATIQELNLVRKHLSRIKGGGLARAATCRRMIVLVLSDVAGDPLDVIASGPAVADHSTSDDAWQVLQKYLPSPAAIPPAIVHRLTSPGEVPPPVTTHVRHVVIGNNRTAVEASVRLAGELGYDVLLKEWDRTGIAHELGAEFAGRCRTWRGERHRRPVCLVSGGEPVVAVSDERPLLGRGGRNQELALACLAEWWQQDGHGMCLVSGGTDGEDGPTSAAGGIADEITRHMALSAGLEPLDALRRHDAWTFLAACEGLLITGLTRTNVMDLRIGLVAGLNDVASEDT